MPRDQRFVATHRGGTLDIERHRLLALWAADCGERLLPLFESERPDDERPRAAIEGARAWACGEIRVGEARRLAVAAHAAAREAADPAAVAAARAAGHAVATAHMADHATGPSYYALKAIRASAGDESAVEDERAWHAERLPEAIRSLIEI